MNSAFNKDSWELDSDFLENKKLDSGSKLNSKIFDDDTKFKYKKSIFFDENLRFDLEIKGEIILDINDKKHIIQSNKLDKLCILFEDGELKYNNFKEKVNIIDKQFLKVTIKKNSIINSFNIISNLKFDSCNPNN
tara:strand:+ start:415 stop:819 length:405 start_codon:yes stop_codon:yes gene_type:complete